MTCPKCQGLLVTERSLDFCARTDSWRCINCGAAPSGGRSVQSDSQAPLLQRRRARTIPLPAESPKQRHLSRQRRE